MKVVASDSPSHTDADALTGERVSEEFVVDTTAAGAGSSDGDDGAGTPAKIHATLEARRMRLRRLPCGVQRGCGTWQYLEPVGQLSDSLEERYDFTAAIPAVSGNCCRVTDATEHVIAVRVYDRFENVVAVKAVVR